MKDIQWLLPKLTDEERDTLSACLAEFSAESPDRNKLAKSANDETIVDLEKRFLPGKAKNLLSSDLRNRVLVAPVGLRPMPVILTTLMVAPSRLYLLHSQDSRPTAESVRDDPYVQALGLDPVRDIVLKEISLTDAPNNYGILREIVRENPKDQLVVDVSGGVKVMGVSLATAAFWLRLPVIYLLGHEVKGIIEPFSERLTELENPFTFFGSPEIESIERLFDLGDYDAALTVCQNLRGTVGDVQTLGTLDILHEFIEVYRDWDLFVHSEAEDSSRRKLATRLRVVVEKMRRFHLEFVDEEHLERNQDFLEQIETTWAKGLRNNSEPHRLVDILAAAQRRAQAGKYDDAVARCYRCLEMGASITLIRDCDLRNAKKPNYDFFDNRFDSREDFADEFQKITRYPLPEDRALGLNDQMALLELSGDKQHKAISGIYKAMTKEDLLESRNRSTLAHGTIPVDSESYRKFEEKSIAIARHVIGKDDLERCRTEALHPDLKLSNLTKTYGRG